MTSSKECSLRTTAVLVSRSGASGVARRGGGGGGPQLVRLAPQRIDGVGGDLRRVAERRTQEVQGRGHGAGRPVGQVQQARVGDCGCATGLERHGGRWKKGAAVAPDLSRRADMLTAASCARDRQPRNQRTAM
jgi:hypothetical protein